MKAIIFSDSHKSFSPMLEAINAEGNINQIIHAGDVHSDVEDLEIMYPKIPVASVKGNNDWLLRDVPEDRLFEFGSIKIFLTHGHNYGVKYSLAKLYTKAEELGADIAIFGHTHVPHTEKIGNILLFNPGAASKSYGILEISNGNPVLEIKNFPL